MIFVASFGYIKGLNELLLFTLPKIIEKRRIKVFTFPKYYIYFQNKKFIIVLDCKDSDIVFGNFLCDDKPVFALDYKFYKKYPQVFGVFYYRKGRPQLKLKKEAIEKFFKKIPMELKDYVE